VPADTHTWADCGVFPVAPYVDASVLCLLYDAIEPGHGGDPRVPAAKDFHDRAAAAGSRMWTSPLALEEAVWQVMRPIITTERDGAGFAHLPLNEFRRTQPTAYARALAEARRYGADVISFVLEDTDVALRWPEGVDGRAIRAKLIAEVTRFLLQCYSLEAADAVHVAMAFADYPNREGHAILTDDRAYQSVDDITVYAYQLGCPSGA